MHRYLGIIAAGVLLLSACDKSGETTADKPWWKADTASKARSAEREHSIYDLLPVAGDTLIAVKWYGGLMLTTDAGKRWQPLQAKREGPRYPSVKELTVDDKRVLWGLDSWVGIHEPDYSRLVFSKDFGRTWVRREFDTHTFFPVSFYSQPKQPMQLVTRTGKVYKPKDAAAQEWSFVAYKPTLNADSISTHPDEAQWKVEFDDGTYKFMDDGKLLVQSGGRSRVLTTISFVDEIKDVCACDSSLYISGHNRSLPSSDYLLRIINGQVRFVIIAPEDGSYLRCDDTNRLWLFSFRGVWELKWGTTLKKRL